MSQSTAGSAAWHCHWMSPKWSYIEISVATLGVGDDGALDQGGGATVGMDGCVGWVLDIA